MAAFSGTPGLVLKLFFLALANAIAIWAAVILADRGKWPALGVLAATTAVIDAIYFARRAVPAKFLIPGTILLLAFQVIPIAYTTERMPSLRNCLPTCGPTYSVRTT